MTKAETISNLKAYLDGDTAIGNIIPLRSVLESVIKYLEPSLPFNLDEAADRQAALEQPYKWEEEQDGSFGVTPLFVMSNIRSSFKAGAECMAGQVMMLKWKYPEEKYQYPECLTRIMDEYGDWHYTISEGHLNPDCEYISLAELSLRLATR